ncbi:MAG: hypothetical protein K1X74_06195 [Pirellulales bacterium]|nr:hypothetical protein [Pirellulales bacterium]
MFRKTSRKFAQTVGQWFGRPRQSEPDCPLCGSLSIDELRPVDAELAEAAGYWSPLYVSPGIDARCLSVPPRDRPWQSQALRLNLLLAAFSFPLRRGTGECFYRFGVLYPNASEDEQVEQIVAVRMEDEQGQQVFAFWLAEECPQVVAELVKTAPTTGKAP